MFGSQLKGPDDKQLRRIFLDGYLYALADGRCQVCNERFHFVRRLLPPPLQRLVGCRRRAVFEMNRQHIIPSSILMLAQDGTRDGLLLCRMLPQIRYLMRTWPLFPDSEELWTERDKAELSRLITLNQQDLLFTCHSHNEPYDQAITLHLSNAVTHCVKERSGPDGRVEALEDRLVNRINRLRTHRVSTDRSCRLVGLHGIGWSQFESLRRSLFVILKTPGADAERRDRWRRSWIRSIVSPSHWMLREAELATVYDHTFAVIAELYGRGRTLPWANMSPVAVRECHTEIVHLRHVVKGIRTVRLQRALAVELPGNLPVDMGEFDTVRTQARRTICKVEREVAVWFDIENAIDFALEWIRLLPGAHGLCWRRSMVDDLVHVFHLRRTFRDCIDFFDHIRLPGSTPGASTRRMWREMMRPMWMGLLSMKFMAVAELLIGRTMRQCQSLIHSGREQASVQALIVGAASLNAESRLVLRKMLSEGPGSVQGRIMRVIDEAAK